MRERLPLGEEYADTTRITPAYAGKTYLTALQCRAYKDHPRVCGKDEKGAVFVPSPLGSPPRMRERHDNKISWYCCDRITPAYAGKTHKSEK